MPSTKVSSLASKPAALPSAARWVDGTSAPRRRCLERRPGRGSTVLVRLAALVFLVISLGPATARAQSIDEARAAYFEVDFERAAELFAALLESASATPAILVDAHRHLAAIRFLEGREPAARLHAQAALALGADVVPPEGSPPELVELFQRLRAETGPASLAIELEDGADALALGEPSRVLVRLIDGAALSAGLSLSCAGAIDDMERRGAAPELRLEVVPTRAQPLDCSASASTTGGAELLSLSRTFAVEASVAEPAAPEEPIVASRDPVEARPDGGGDDTLTWVLGIGAAVLVVGVAVGVGVALGTPTRTAVLAPPEVEGWTPVSGR